jgi:hypothetical protein
MFVLTDIPQVLDSTSTFEIILIKKALISEGFLQLFYLAF